MNFCMVLPFYSLIGDVKGIKNSEHRAANGK